MRSCIPQPAAKPAQAAREVELLLGQAEAEVEFCGRAPREPVWQRKGLPPLFPKEEWKDIGVVLW